MEYSRYPIHRSPNRERTETTREFLENFDLSQTLTERLAGEPFLKSLLYRLKHGWQTKPLEVLAEIFKMLRNPETNAPNVARLETVWI